MTAANSRRVQALVLSPTRELAAQTEKNILALGEFLKVQAHCCIGGKSLGARLNPTLGLALGSPNHRLTMTHLLVMKSALSTAMPPCQAACRSDPADRHAPPAWHENTCTAHKIGYTRFAGQRHVGQRVWQMVRPLHNHHITK